MKRNLQFAWCHGGELDERGPCSFSYDFNAAISRSLCETVSFSCSMRAPFLCPVVFSSSPIHLSIPRRPHHRVCCCGLLMNGNVWLRTHLEQRQCYLRLYRLFDCKNQSCYLMTYQCYFHVHSLLVYGIISGTDRTHFAACC